MKAYCVKCKKKRDMQDPQAVFTSTGTPATRGICSVCGTKMFRMGRTEAHEGLQPPENTRRKKKKQLKRSGKLVIVESPAKARTVKRILGTDFTVKASVGHVRDLLRSKLSVNVENNFEPRYRVPNEKRPVVKELKTLAERAEEVYLATDLDREGEAIAWHLLEAADISPERSYRVVFHEITRPAITQAFNNPRSIDMCLVDAQQGRRILDRLVGYKISPILWRKVRSRLSAGRVQSVALRLIVEREAEIDVFVPEEYWSIQAEFHPIEAADDVLFTAKLIKIDNQEPELSQESDVLPILNDMEMADYLVTRIKRGKRKRNPSAPFITSTMQQEAYRRYGFTPRQTMAVAQQLYEGVELGEGESKGLITYMRTDSTNVSELAQKEAKEYIANRYGQKYLPEKPPQYRTKAQRAQEAHEAIRPTSVKRTPKSVRKHLKRNQYRLYRLIWQRFVASQMAAAIYDTISVKVTGKTPKHRYQLRASGFTIRFPGFLVVYKEAKDEDENGNNGEMLIPTDLKENQRLDLIRLIPNQHFTQPPARYTDASLVRALEENGIGRPS
ncbi:MAG: type I DNA topoisomerase, partial [Anaerolineales bacterium]